MLPRSPTRRYLAFHAILWLAIALFIPHALHGTEDRLATLARQYAESFADAAFDQIEDRYTPDMKAAMTRSASMELREALIKLAHDNPDGYQSQDYLPEEIADRKFYAPTDHGYEKMIGERMLYWQKLKQGKK